MSRVISAHIVVEFNQADGDLRASVEIDDRVTGYNGGRSSFNPGDEVYLLLFKPAGSEVSLASCTAGRLVKHTDDYKEIEQYVSFPNEDSSSVSYPLSRNLAYSWEGEDLGTINAVNENTLGLPVRAIDPVSRLPDPRYRIGIAHVTYEAACEVWRLYAVPGDIAQVLAFFVITKP